MNKSKIRAGGGLSISAKTPSSLTSTLTSTNVSASTISSNYSTTTAGYYSTGDSYSWTLNGDVEIGDESVKKIIEKIFDSDNDLLPLVKNYLIKYLDQIMDNPEEIIKDLIREKDYEIIQLKQKLEYLTKRIEELENDRKTSEEEEVVKSNWAKAVPSTWTTTTTGGGYDYGDSSTSSIYCSQPLSKGADTDYYDSVYSKVSTLLGGLGNTTSENG